MRFGITVSFATLAVVLATSQQADDNAAHNSLVTRQSQPPAGGAPGGPDTKLQGDPKICAAIIKMIEAHKSGGAGGGAPPASSPKTRRDLPEAGSHYLTRRAPPAGDSKGGAGAAPADSCKKLQDMIKKGAPSGASPKPNTGSGTPSPQTKPPKTGSSATPDASASSTPAATPNAAPATAPARRDLNHNAEHNSLSTRENKPAGGDASAAGAAGAAPEGKFQGDPKACAAILKMIEALKAGGAGAGASGSPGASPKTRRELSGAHNDRMIRRAAPAGDSKPSSGAAPADSCKKLQEMAKKAMLGAGSKTKSGSASPPAASPEAKPKGGAAATPDATATPPASPDASSTA